MDRSRIQNLLGFLQNQPNDPFIKYALAMEHLRVHETHEALSYLEDLLANHPNYLGTYYQLGKLYQVLNRHNDALKAFQEGMTIAKGQGDMHTLSELQAAYNVIAELEDED